jgi:hypothetical protein
MTMRGLRRTSLSATLLIAASASILSAQGRRLFEWTGDVDREVQIIMRGRDIWTRDRGNREASRHWERINGALPRTDGYVVVRMEDGRGDADVVQQPSARNNYTTIVRVRDRRGGADRYSLDAYWRPDSNGRWDTRNNGEVYPSNPRDRDDDGWYDREDGRGSRGPYVPNPNNSRTAFHWSGDVDDVLEIRVQGQRVEYRTLSGAQPRGVRASTVDIPARNATFRVTENQGRGEVRVTQQPSMGNGFTTVLRVNDPQGGYGRYDFDLVW